MGKWDRFESAVKRLHADFDHPSVDIYTYSGGYDQSTGEINWTRSLAGSTTADVVEATSTREATQVVGPEGQQQDVDAEIWIPDDTGISIDEVGDDDTKPTEVEPPDGTVYIVVEKFDEGNGLVRLVCVES